MNYSIFPIAILTYKEGLRSRVLYGVIIAAFFLIFLAVLISGFFMRDILKVLLDICLTAVSVGGLLVPFFLGINLLAGDIEKRTIYTLLARDITRSNYILGKFLGLTILTGTIILILTLASFIAVYSATVIYPSHNYETLALYPVILSVLMNFLGILVLNSTVVLWCSTTTSSFLATLLTLSTYIIGHSAEDMVRFMSMRLSDVETSPLVQATTHAVLYIFPNLGAFDLKQQAAYCLPIPSNEILFLCLYGFSYISIMLFLATFFFKRRDLP